MKTNIPSLAGGGQVMAIVPQTFEETFRISRAVVSAGLAPSALIGKKTGDDAASAVAVCIMSGAELGLKPMVSLRSFTVINGKPALYGDGLINVVRQSGKVKLLDFGYTKYSRRLLRAAGVLPSEEDEKEFPGCTEEAFKALSEDERAGGYCEAERLDTGEKKTVIFTVSDAKRAGLYQENSTVDKYVWENGSKVFKKDQPNDAPWYRFYKRMFGWRAAGFCLRELFGDVLGGIRDEFEAREISDADEMRDVTPHTPPKPPAPPSPPVEDAEVTDVTDSSDQQADEQVVDGASQIDASEFFQELEEALSGAMDDATIEEIWTGLDPEGTFDGDDVNLDIAHKIKQRRLAQIHPLNGG
ncbi:hypothetical protein ASC90_22070 [Rhizobium sp. Root1220]|nr:hypothetical protein ASC90_22070 [Rhizobium sp. Root1220]